MTHAKYRVEFLLDKQKILFLLHLQQLKHLLILFSFQIFMFFFFTYHVTSGLDTAWSNASYAFTICKRLYFTWPHWWNLYLL